MLTKIKISNFKSFSEEQTLELAPITLIFGPNSSGKSTIIQSLLGVKQTLLSPQVQGDLVANGSCLDLNSYESIVNGHDITKNIKIAFSFSLNLSAIDYKDIYSSEPVFAMSDIRNINLTYSYKKPDEVGTSSSYLKKFKYSVDSAIGGNEEKIRLEISKGEKDYTQELIENYYGQGDTVDSLSKYIYKRIERVIGENEKAIIKNSIWTEIKENIYKINKNISIPFTLQGTKKYFAFANSYLDRFSIEIKNELENIKYLGPLRTTPKRFYLPGTNNNIKMKGESNLGGELYESGEKTIVEINNWLTSFEIPYTLSIQNFGNKLSGDIISIVLKDQRNDAEVTPMDVGFGIGQVLPIITDAIVSKNSIICVEQPEIHLHPRLQAHLADLFIGSVLSNKLDRNSKIKNQWIIETHSEALMLRIQRRIREKKINKELVKVYYVNADKNGSKVIDLPLDDDGDFLTHWPHGFFDERTHEIFGGY
ncbi:DUF3696 domain-containing protein [Providencia sp.]|uniref:DUF3696 domain-containing protein n=1 Tax=Providencia sp. TaxID=589 RepID=UPI001B7584CD|nr:DUF3696 domain-containing protein [Providencia sp.]MBP6122571.1 DUF3696 domain-containing protein [Providencia sp.]